MGSSLLLTYKDYEGETSTVKFKGVTIVAGNFAAEDTKIDALQIATNNLTVARLQKNNRVYEETQVSALPADSVHAQRERKWLVKYHDETTNNAYVLEIPGADLTLLDSGARDGSIDKTAAVYTAFETAFNAYHITPDGNAAVLDDLIHVGRNL